jgi:ribonucleoside-diphosphate reductase alpha chain
VKFQISLFVWIIGIKKLFKSSLGAAFRNQFAVDIFTQKYRHEGAWAWEELARTVVEDVCRANLTKDEKDQLTKYIADMKFLPGGRYLYYAGREKKFFNNCYLLRSEEDTREDWANLSWKAESCLATGGGIGNDYSIYRASGSILHGTGGIASGPVSKAYMVNEIGRQIMQGGSRRSAIYASLNCGHADIPVFMGAKNWDRLKIAGTEKTFADVRKEDFNFPCPLDMTNISINYDTKWLLNYWQTGYVGKVFLENVKQALSTGEPGFSFNFFDKENETLRNACTEVSSADDSDVCNLGSVNFSRISSLTELMDVVALATKFLVCGTLVAKLPYEKVYKVREKNRRLGLGLMGLHEWLVQRGYRYECTDELKRWLTIYRDISADTGTKFSASLGISSPVAFRAIAPTGSIGILAGTTTGIEPIFAVAYKRRYLKGTAWRFQYVIDGAARTLMDLYGVDHAKLESALDLSNDYQRRIAFQADVQDFVDMAISSTINLPKWDAEKNGDEYIERFANCLASNAHRLRGFTCYPDGSRGGQPLVSVPYTEARDKLGEVFEEHVEAIDVCSITGRGGACGS